VEERSYGTRQLLSAPPGRLTCTTLATTARAKPLHAPRHAPSHSTRHATRQTTARATPRAKPHLAPRTTHRRVDAGSARTMCSPDRLSCRLAGDSADDQSTPPSLRRVARSLLSHQTISPGYSADNHVTGP